MIVESLNNSCFPKKDDSVLSLEAHCDAALTAVA